MKMLSHSFQNYYSNQTKQTPQGVLSMGDQDLQLREEPGSFQTNLSKNFIQGAHFHSFIIMTI